MRTFFMSVGLACAFATLQPAPAVASQNEADEPRSEWMEKAHLICQQAERLYEKIEHEESLLIDQRNRLNEMRLGTNGRQEFREEDLELHESEVKNFLRKAQILNTLERCRALGLMSQ